MKFSSALAALFLISQPVFADTYIKSQMMVAGEAHTWLSGNKKRVETKPPLVGPLVMITRVDRGVQWILMPDKKIYQEKPIALPYARDKEGSQQGFDGESNTESFGGLPNDCTPEVRQLAGTRKIAGFEATGFTLGCGKETVPGKIWMAPPAGLLADIERQDKFYNHEHAAALFANYPPREKQELMFAVENLGDMARTFISERIGKSVQFPRGVLMALEGKGKILYEVKSIENNPVDPALFEIPPGYQKVPNLAKAAIEESMKNLNAIADAVESFKKFLEQSGLAGLAQRAQKAFEQYTQNRT